MTPDDAINTVNDYHERTKHRFDGYARGPSTIDWEAQPDSFRRYDGAPLRELPLQPEDEGPSYAELADRMAITAAGWNEETLSALLQFSMGLAAWKEYRGARWSLRCNPSSGNLHPTETYVICVGVRGFDDGLYHYRVDRHGLELRCRYRTKSHAAPTLFLGLSSIPWREAWKYGERAYRYCQLDLGHALAAVDFCAATLGWRALPLSKPPGADLDRLLGLDRAAEFHADEAEHGDLLIAITASDQTPGGSTDDVLRNLGDGEWFGRANRLDPDHQYDWPVIARVTAATRPSETDTTSPPASTVWPAPLAPPEHPLARASARSLIRRRRSAQAFDPRGEMLADDFFRLLDRTLPRRQTPPWNAQAWPSRLHLLLFVHRVRDLEPGLYLLGRQPDALDRLRTQLRDDLQWEAATEAPNHLPLVRLAVADARQAARHLGCHQDIASDSAFSLSMLAEFESEVEVAPWRYDRLFWEAGMIGQTLYLEAEAIGLRGTGIGCFFDDAVHQMLGIQHHALQALYHFTVGTALLDPRLRTLPPYPRSTQEKL